MPSIIPLLLALALVIAAAKLGGWLSNRMGQPAVLGELTVGLLPGPSVLNVFGQPYFETAHTGALRSAPVRTVKIKPGE